ncbi:hypothetical protein ACIBAI_23120 [Streptomyces sp. NPDC051041]|uniref:hypothetical protein n=1 Tax=Streptomyces sp. NPDC051041 TaxID=3365640 RepID=UPI00379003EC
MPTPYGSRGGMAFGAEELRVLRRALALALHHGPACAGDVQDCLRLAESLDEALREGARLRAFLVADLARYRAALPGAAAGYLALLDEALGAGHRPGPDDLAALRALRGHPGAAALLRRCRVPAGPGPARAPGAAAPAPRTRLLSLPGGLAGSAEDPAGASGRSPAEKPAPRPVPAAGRPAPAPGEACPRREPAAPASRPPRRLAAG